MFQRILIPLDGSARAERAVDVGARIARASGGSILLLQVVGIPVDYNTYGFNAPMVQTPVLANDLMDTEIATAESYLASIMKSDALAGIQTETKSTIGSAVPVIEDMISNEQVDLIVMCSHGDTGFKRWVLGSVAQKISRHSQVPVLVLHQDGSKPDSPFPDQLRPLRSISAMVALDGSEFAEAAIEPTATLVSALASPAQGMLLLTRVVTLDADGTEPETKKQALDEANAYLDNVTATYAAAAQRLNVTLTTSVALGKDAAEALIRAAEEGVEAERQRLTGNCDLIAMTTHGRSGFQRLTMGSVTERVLGTTKLPLLVVHSQAAEEK